MALSSQIKQNRFTRGMRRNLRRQFKAGEINEKQFNDAFFRTYNPTLVAEVMQRTALQDDLLGAINWEKLLNWLWEHRAEILKLIMSIVVMFLDEQE